MNKIAYNNCFGGFELSEAAIQWLIDHGKTREWCNSCGFNYNYRHDPLLIQCIEELGQKANGQCSKLAIEEIEEDYYQIIDYDGSELIITPNNINWIVI